MTNEKSLDSREADVDGVQPRSDVSEGNRSSAEYGGAFEVDVWEILRRGWWILVLSVLVGAVGGAAYTLSATPWYRAEVQLAPSDQKSMPPSLSSLGGLASLAGISIGSAGTAEPLAVLRSREFAAEFIKEHDLLPILLADEWDSVRKVWKESDPSLQPDLRDAVDYFRRKVLAVGEDKKSGMVSLTVQWTNPELAANWANTLVDRLNSRMRSRALEESRRNLEFLQEEMAATNVAALQQSIGRVVETEMQKILLARGNEQFSFKVIDTATPPRNAYKPQPLLLVGGAGAIGGVVALFILFLGQVRRLRTR